MSFKKVFFGFILLLISVTILSGFCIAADTPKQKHAPNALPGVEPEMLNPEYWISLQPDADKIIMTPAEIEKFNEKVRTKRVTFRNQNGQSDPIEGEFVITEKKGPVMNPLQPLEMPATIPGDSLKARLKSNVEWLYSRDFYDDRNLIYSDTMKDDLVKKMNMSAIPSVIIRKFGVTVNHALVRHYPTSVPGYNETKWEMDMFQATALLIGNPVCVLHESADGDFLYIESPVSRGWVDARDIAFADRETVRRFTGDKNFLMATGNKEALYADKDFKIFAKYFYFSSTLPIMKKLKDSYIVGMPYKRPDGTLGVTKGYLKPNADVHEGYLPYTKKNVITQIFKLLNQPYGWADQDYKRDCSGTMRVLFNCFGIKTGRHPSFILSASDHQVFIDPKLSKEEKTAEISKIEPVITVAGSSGHIVLYLGKAKNGKLYFMHQAGWGYTDENGQDWVVNRVSLNVADHSWYSIDGPGVFTTLKL